MEELEIRDLWNIFMENIQVIILVTLCAALLGLGYSMKIKKPEYESSAKVILVNEDEKLILSKEDLNMMQGEIALNQKLVTTYSEILKSRLVLENVIKTLNLNIAPEILAEKITVSSVEETEVINISVKENEAALAANIANGLVDAFKKEVARIYKIENVQVVDKAIPGTYNYRAVAIKNMIIFAAIGFVVIYGIYFLKSYFSNKITKIEDVENLKINVLGKIPVSVQGGTK